MSIAKLTERFKILCRQELDFMPVEKAVIDVLASSKTQVDSSRVAQMITLVDNVTSLRKLIHAQLRDLLVELHAQQQSTNISSSQKVASADSSSRPLPIPAQDSPVAPSVEIAKATSKPLGIREPSGGKRAQSLSDSPPQPTPLDLDETPGIEDLELEDLKREVAFLTSPTPFSSASPSSTPSSSTPTSSTPTSSTLLSSTLLSSSPLSSSLLSSSESNAFYDSSQDFPFDLADLDTTPPPTALDSNPSKKSDLNSEDDRSELAANDFTSVFPESAGEAGTAIFDIDLYRAQQQEKNSLVTENLKPNEAISLSVISIKTPHQSFAGQAIILDERELLVSAKESLLAGEEVRLSFELERTGMNIECKALVRKKKTSDPQHASLCLRFLDLRPSQLASIRSELELSL